MKRSYADRKSSFWKRHQEPSRTCMILPEFGNKQIQMLGNSVVPDAVREAFCFLFCVNTHAHVALTTQVVLKCDNLSDTHYPTAGTVTMKNDNAFLVSEIDLPRPEKWKDYGLVLDPKAYKQQRDIMRFERKRGVLVDRPVKKTHWATLSKTDGTSGTCLYLTHRSLGKIRTQVRFEKGTPDSTRSHNLSPRFTEWLMGFPIGWTHLSL